MAIKLNFSGIVQGIGFRPTAQRLAKKLGLFGYVKNSGGSVEILITGKNEALDIFVKCLISMFEIKDYTKEIIKCDKKFTDFTIVHSQRDNSIAFITPDLATCPDCERELQSDDNRRFNHPFISCINCGPRYTIIDTLPYDRENTVMNDFALCRECEKEYTEVLNRRCHAQTIACNNCGPETNISIDNAIQILKQGKILAIKDIGGYHFACDVNSISSVNDIRKLKGRYKKPFAVMFSNIDEIEEYCHVNNKEKELLLSAARPIVLLKKKKDFDKSVCGESDKIGAFLPCNPIQILILNKISPLVMTSANITGEVIETDDEKIKRFGVPILSHNRRILTPIDDSVLQAVNGHTQFLRRARGYVPLAIDIGIKAKKTTLCMGGDLKASFAFHKDKYVFLSQYFGDLENIDIKNTYKNNIKRFEKLHSFYREKTVCDKHPNYFSSNIFDCDLKIQHHKAHIASVIAEHKLKGKVLGFAFDGTGYGDDGAIWGSEIFIFDTKKFERINHLKYTKMTASNEISKNCDLALACYLGTNEIINSAIKAEINTVNSSSMGRLFDAVCALLDIKHYNTYEGECACALEICAKKSSNPYPLTISLEPIKILKEIKKALQSGAKVCDLALGFHLMLAKMITKIALQVREKSDINQIALSGGVFNNNILLENAFKNLEEKGFEVYTNELVPCGDGGIAFGQAYISALEE